MDKKILVIEDDPAASRLMEFVLEEKGYQVLTATNGIAGIKLAQNEKPDLIVLDLMLPGIDGFEICHRLRSDPDTAQITIMMLSAKAQEIDRETGLKVGADDYVTKPSEPEEIVRRVESLLAKKNAAKSEMIAFLGAKSEVGSSTVVINVGLALSQKNKRVIVVDMYPSEHGMTECLGLKPERTINELLAKPIDTITGNDLEATLAVHETGIRVLTISKGPGNGRELSPPDVSVLFEKLREVTDYLLVDLPSQPSDSEKAVLTGCNLIIVVTDSKPDALPGVRSTAALLNKLGITQDRMGTVIVDRDAIFPEMEISKMKSTIEQSTGISLLGVIPYDTKTSLEPVPNGTPLILSDLNYPITWAMREVAGHIVGEKVSNQESS